jgi:hypothetical protein
VPRKLVKPTKKKEPAEHARNRSPACAVTAFFSQFPEPRKDSLTSVARQKKVAFSLRATDGDGALSTGGEIDGRLPPTGREGISG